MSRILIGSALALVLASCANPQDLNGDGIVDATEGGRSPDTVQLVAPSSPVGSVSGVVLNSRQVGIEGVSVTLVLGEGTEATHLTRTTTSSDGAFVFKNVPAGATGQVLVTKSGYTTARNNVSVPGAAGNIPINNGNGNAGIFTLLELNSTLSVQVFTAAGEPAKDAAAVLEVSPASYVSTAGFFSSTGTFSTTGKVDEKGVLTFSGIPDPGELTRFNNASFTLTIGALDTDANGTIDFLGTVLGYSAQSLFTRPPAPVVLADARSTNPLGITATNIESLLGTTAPYRNSVRANDAINVVFNQPIARTGSALRVKVVQEDCQTEVPVMLSTTLAPNVLTITPTAAWTSGNRYNVSIRATGTDSGSNNDFTGFFFAIDESTPQELSATGQFQVRKATGNMMASAYQVGDTINVVFNTPIINQGTGNALVRINLDLNNDGDQDDPGEANGPVGSGFPIFNNEQTRATDPNNGTFTCRTSGYSSRWSFTISPVPMSGIPMSTTMRVVFPRDSTNGDTFQTAWGTPVVADVTGQMVVVP